MKAKEYVKLWNEWQENRPKLGEIYPDAPENERDKKADSYDLINYLGLKVLSEFHVLVKARKAQHPAALAAIVRELDQKWKAICNRIDDVIPPDFLKSLMKAVETNAKKE
jgi:hypothetical protein